MMADQIRLNDGEEAVRAMDAWERPSQGDLCCALLCATRIQIASLSRIVVLQRCAALLHCIVVIHCGSTSSLYIYARRGCDMSVVARGCGAHYNAQHTTMYLHIRSTICIVARLIALAPASLTKPHESPDPSYSQCNAASWTVDWRASAA
jgi:hypothetical protein